MAEQTLQRARPIDLDPRFRRRRIEVRRREGRRRLMVIGGILAVAGSAGVGWGALRSPLLDVDRVRVTGAVRTPVAEVLAASGVRPGMALVDVDAETAATTAARLPWVLRVRVIRDWPASVSVQVTEREPVAVARVGDRSWALIDGDGRVLDSVAEPPPGLPTVSAGSPVGPSGTRLDPAWAPVLSVATSAPSQLRGRLSAVVEAEGGGVELRLAPDGVVRFGPPEQVGEKFTAVATVLAQVDTDDLAVLDVRIPRSPVLTRREAAARVSTRAAG